MPGMGCQINSPVLEARRAMVLEHESHSSAADAVWSLHQAIEDTRVPRNGLWNARAGVALAIRRTLAILLVSANLGFWIYFWLDFAVRSVPYRHYEPVFENIPSTFVVFNRAVPYPLETLRPGFKWASHLHAPSFLSTRPVTSLLNKVGTGADGISVWDRAYYGISPGGYQLIGVMVISFGQWLLVAHCLASLWSILRSAKTGGMGHAQR